MTSAPRPGSIAPALALGVVMLCALVRVPVLRAEPEIYKRLVPLKPWIAIVDDPATADSAWTGLAALMPTLADSAQRGFGWYLMYSAAAALGHVDSMQVAAESSFVYSPNDPSGLRSLSQYLGHAGHHLELAERYAVRTLENPADSAVPAQRLDDLRWLALIQLKRDADSAAAVTLERHVKESKAPDAWVLFRLGEIHARAGRDSLAIERLSLGLSQFPLDSADAHESAARLDSLVRARGGDVAAARARVARAQEASKRAYWIDSHRDGHAAPSATFVELASGRRESLRDARGITVAYAWATWCGPCRHSLPVLQDWAARPRTAPVRVVTVNAEGDPLETAKPLVTKFVTEKGIRLPVLMADTSVASRWKLVGFPMTLVLRDGKIVYRGHGGELVEGLEAELESLDSRPAVAAAPPAHK